MSQDDPKMQENLRLGRVLKENMVPAGRFALLACMFGASDLKQT